MGAWQAQHPGPRYRQQLWDTKHAEHGVAAACLPSSPCWFSIYCTYLVFMWVVWVGNSHPSTLQMYISWLCVANPLTAFPTTGWDGTQT